jgi:hypothetical protein
MSVVCKYIVGSLHWVYTSEESLTMRENSLFFCFLQVNHGMLPSMESYHCWSWKEHLTLWPERPNPNPPLSLPHHNILPMQHHKNHTERKGCDAVELSKCYWVGDELSAELRQQRDGRENGDTDQVRFLLLP